MFFRSNRIAVQRGRQEPQPQLQPEQQNVIVPNLNLVIDAPQQEQQQDEEEEQQQPSPPPLSPPPPPPPNEKIANAIGNGNNNGNVNGGGDRPRNIIIDDFIGMVPDTIIDYVRNLRNDDWELADKFISYLRMCVNVDGMMNAGSLLAAMRYVELPHRIQLRTLVSMHPNNLNVCQLIQEMYGDDEFRPLFSGLFFESLIDSCRDVAALSDRLWESHMRQARHKGVAYIRFIDRIYKELEPAGEINRFAYLLTLNLQTLIFSNNNGLSVRQQWLCFLWPLFMLVRVCMLNQMKK